LHNKAAGPTLPGAWYIAALRSGLGVTLGLGWPECAGTATIPRFADIAWRD
jgi:hypothetical protein